MLAYVFWHWPNQGIDQKVYQEKLRDFHRVLASNPSPGFKYSVALKLNNPPWLQTSGDAYEDWYLVDDSAALDPLNEAAISGPREQPHNQVAKDVAGGTAGLYRVKQGAVDNLLTARFACWFAKPAGVSYSDFFAQLKPLSSSPGACLWGRQMTLGPTTEFCLQSPGQLSLPPGYQGHVLELEIIWPGKGESD
ncbi:MAG TPA: hypothetical protein VKB46_06225 [Pyrinomonadaceae bacterium]|nr:hypothetical protein [Pyrinomonadaceae bacterium]